MSGGYHRSGPFGKLQPPSDSQQPEQVTESGTPEHLPMEVQEATAEPGWWAEVPGVSPQESHVLAQSPQGTADDISSNPPPQPEPSRLNTQGEQPDVSGMIEKVTEDQQPFNSDPLDVVNPFQREYRVAKPRLHTSSADTLPSWRPENPRSLKAAGLNEHEVLELILKFLLTQGVATGKGIARQIRLCYSITEQMLNTLRHEQFIVYRKSTGNDFEYQLTSTGMERATRYYRQSSYHGSAPVSLDDYVASVQAQSVIHRKPGVRDLKYAFRELLLGDELLSQLGQALHSGTGLFLFGPPGNGKTSIAQRMTDVFGDSIWIPRSVNAYGEIIRLFDPNKHQELPEPTTNKDELDQRWVRIARPTVVVGGELRMENLEITRCQYTGISEAPLQMKSNCGTLVIDDFGRQRMATSELLNRWIIPLENRFDLLNLTSGRTIRIPFDQLIVFSTNLEPRELVEEAFLRRIPYKIEVHNPTEQQYQQLFLETARSMGFQCSSDVVDYLIEHHYRLKKREFRFCHVRDLLRQVQNFCTFHEQEFLVSRENIDMAVMNYFSVM